MAFPTSWPYTITNGTTPDATEVMANLNSISSHFTGKTGGQLLIANSSGVVTAQTMSGDVTVSNTGVASLSANSVGSSEIATDAVGSSEIAANAVGSSEIASGAVTASEIAAGAVGTAELAANAVTSAKIGANEVQAGDYQLGAQSYTGTTATHNLTGSWSSFSNLSMSATTSLCLASMNVAVTSGNAYFRWHFDGVGSGQEVVVSGLGTHSVFILAGNLGTHVCSIFGYTSGAATVYGTRSTIYGLRIA